MTKKINKRYYNTKEGLQYFSSQGLSNSLLLLLACTLWSYIMKLLGVQSGSIITTLLLYVSPIGSLFVYVICSKAFKKEQQALTLTKDSKPDKLVYLLSKLAILELFITLASLIVYVIISTRLNAVISASASDEIAYYNATKMAVRIKVVTNAIDKIFSVSTLIFIFIIKLYIDEQDNIRLHNFAFASVVITLVVFLLLMINYILQYIGKSNTVFSTLTNLLPFVMYISQYLTIEARREKCRQITEETGNNAEV